MGWGGWGCRCVVVRTSASCACLSRAANLKWVSASALTPSAGLTSRTKTLRPFPPKAGSRRPQCKYITQPQGEEKDCEARPPHPPLLRRKGGRNLFHRLGVECPWSGMLTGGTLTRVFLVRRTLLTMLLPLTNRVTQ